MIKRILVTLAAGALFAPLAFSQTQNASAQKNGQKTAEQITVTGTTITAIEDGAAANYQPPKTLVVRQIATIRQATMRSMVRATSSTSAAELCARPFNLAPGFVFTTRTTAT